MGQKSSHLALSNEASLPALDVDPDLTVTRLKHPAAWDEHLAPAAALHSEQVEGTNLSRLFGASGAECVGHVLRAAGQNMATLLLDVVAPDAPHAPPLGACNSNGSEEENGLSTGSSSEVASAVGKRCPTSLSVIVVIVSIQDGGGGQRGCCAAPRRRLWLVPEHLSGSQKFLSRCECQTISRCAACALFSINGLQYYERVDLLSALCKRGVYLFHRVATTTCRGCMVKQAFTAKSVNEVTPRARRSDESLPLFSPRTSESVMRRTFALVVVPEKDCRDRIDALLRRAKFIPVLCSSATQALGYLNKGEPVGLIVCDVMLPATSGFELIKQVRAANSSLPILAVGGSVGFSELAIQCGANAFHQRSALDADLRISIFSLCAAVM